MMEWRGPGAAFSIATVMLLGSAPAPAQDGYPAKVIRIVTSAPGSNNDWGARLLADEIAPNLGQRLIVENRGGLAAEVVAKSPPDGYTMLFYGPSAWTMQLYRPVGYDPVRDLAPVIMAISSPIVLVVHPSVPVKSVKELIALARARPGALNYASGTIGATPFVAGELFKYMAKVNIVRVPYSGTGPSVIGLVSGEVELMFPGAGSVWHFAISPPTKCLSPSKILPCWRMCVRHWRLMPHSRFDQERWRIANRGSARAKSTWPSCRAIRSSTALIPRGPKPVLPDLRSMRPCSAPRVARTPSPSRRPMSPRRGRGTSIFSFPDCWA